MTKLSELDGAALSNAHTAAAADAKMATTLTERLNFSDRKTANSIEISKCISTRHDQILRSYCAQNDIDLSSVSDDEIDACAELMQDHGMSDASARSYQFWIDRDPAETWLDARIRLRRRN
jgi:hypothetical protein